MVAAPFGVLLLAIFAIIGQGEEMMLIREGFIGFWDSPLLPIIILIGLFSQGTGIFGTLVFLDKRENTYSVPVNRCSSIIAGVMASCSLLFFFPDQASSLRVSQLVGAFFIIQAILFLTIPAMLAKRKSQTTPRNHHILNELAKSLQSARHNLKTPT